MFIELQYNYVHDLINDNQISIDLKVNILMLSLKRSGTKGASLNLWKMLCKQSYGNSEGIKV